MNLKKSSFKN